MGVIKHSTVARLLKSVYRVAYILPGHRFMMHLYLEALNATLCMQLSRIRSRCVCSNAERPLAQSFMKTRTAPSTTFVTAWCHHRCLLKRSHIIPRLLKACNELMTCQTIRI